MFQIYFLYNLRFVGAGGFGVFTKVLFLLSAEYRIFGKIYGILWDFTIEFYRILWNTMRFCIQNSVCNLKSRLPPRKKIVEKALLIFENLLSAKYSIYPNEIFRYKACLVFQTFLFQ